MHRFLVSGIYGFLFFLPLINFKGNGSSPWEFPKLCFAVISVSVLFTAYLLWKLRESSFEFRYNKILFILALFTGSSLVSFFMAINPHLSFWGDKLLPSDSMITILTAFLIAALILQLKISQKAFYFLAAGILGLQTAFALIQIFEVNLPWWGFHYQVFGTQGQPVAYSTLIGCLAPFICAYFFRRENRFIENLAAGALLFGVNFTALHSGSRMPLAVLWLTLFITAIYFFLQRSHFNSLKKTVALIVIIAGSTVLFQIQEANSEITSKLSTNLISKGFDTRTLVLKSGLDAWKEKPLFGYGPQMFIVAHRPFQTAEINSFEYWENGWIKAHNHLADVLVNQGAVGLALLLLIYGLLFFKSAVLFFKKPPTERDVFSLACFAGFNYLFLANLTAFNMITTQYLFILLPVLFSIDDAKVQRITLRPGIRAVVAGLSLLVAGILSLNTINVWRADVLMQSWLRNEKIKADKIKSLDLTIQATTLNPGEGLNYCYTGRIYTEMLSRNYKSLKQTDLQNSLQAIEDNMNQCMSLSPGLIHNVQLTAEVYQELFFQGVISSPEKALAYYDEVQKTIPYNPKIYLEVGRLLLKAGNEPAFLEAEKKAISLKPDYVPAYIELLQNYYRKNDLEAVYQLTENFSQTRFNSWEFVPYIPDLATIAESFGDVRSKEIFQNVFELYKHLIPATKN